GISKKVIIINFDEKINVFINPEIEVLDEEKEEDEEGCLSLPGIREQVERYKKVRLKAQDVKGKDTEMVAEGMLARILQHETDHLEGILFIDRLDKKKKREVISRINEMG
ncbi:MAG: peptide deformylase, partial [Candidatus Humimicrobiaceae bacterium]